VQPRDDVRRRAATLLFYVVAAWEDDFTGYVIDYGTYPDQQRPYFTLRDARLTLADGHQSGGLEGAIYAGPRIADDQCLGREWRRDDGAALRIERCLIDANWGSSTDVVYQFCRQSAHAGDRHAQPRTIRRARRASRSPSTSAGPATASGTTGACPTCMASARSPRDLRHELLEVVRPRRLGVAMGDRGCLSLFGERPKSIACSPSISRPSIASRPKDAAAPSTNGSMRPERGDNHWFDRVSSAAPWQKNSRNSSPIFDSLRLNRIGQFIDDMLLSFEE
jgi:hypothetical protein